MLTDSSHLVLKARENGVGVPAFNGITLEHGEAIVAAAERADTGVILALSHNAVRFHGSLTPVALAYRALAEAASVPIGLHLDHVEDMSLLAASIGLGFSSVMFDASHLPYADNAEVTRRAGDLLHGHGLWIEAELGEIGGKDGAHSPTVRTSPEEAARFVRDTGVDALAVAVGSSHAMTTASAELDLALIARLKAAVDVPLVLHGSSGVPDSGIAAGVRAGLVKINVGTQLNVAYSQAVRESMSDSSDPRPYLTVAREAMTQVVERLIAVIA